MIHELKTDPDVFDAVDRGDKTFELRKDDRDFAVGDTLRLRQTAHTGSEMAMGAPLIYTGKTCVRRVTHILRGPRYGLVGGLVILSLDKHRTLRESAGNRPKVVCLCGSTRFIAEMACIAWTLERDEGYITLGLHLLPPSYPDVQRDHMAEHEGKKEHFDELHKRKIDLADSVFVVNIGGYIGESTRSEIAYATAHGKPVKYLEPA